MKDHGEGCRIQEITVFGAAWCGLNIILLRPWPTPYINEFKNDANNDGRAKNIYHQILCKQRNSYHWSTHFNTAQEPWGTIKLYITGANWMILPMQILYLWILKKATQTWAGGWQQLSQSLPPAGLFLLYLPLLWNHSLLFYFLPLLGQHNDQSSQFVCSLIKLIIHATHLHAETMAVLKHDPTKECHTGYGTSTGGRKVPCK